MDSGDIEVFAASYVAAKYFMDPVVAGVTNTAKQRVAAVIERARAKSGERGFCVEERTAWTVLDSAVRTDSAVVADYLGGVLAASTEDDMAVPIAAQVSRLSTLELRIHFVLYRTAKRFVEIHTDPANDLWVVCPDLFISLADVRTACDLPPGPSGLSRLEQAMRDLGREGLLGELRKNTYNGSPPELFLVRPERVRDLYSREFPEPGLVYSPSIDGMSLLAWGLGAPNPSPITYAQDQSAVDEIGGVVIPSCESVIPVNDLEICQRT